MKNWMTVKDLSHYLQISENKIRFFIKHKQIPCHNNHGFLRFKREEIDVWMSTPAREESAPLRCVISTATSKKLCIDSKQDIGRKAIETAS
jgi:excisionase family DNA binding protein